ncbi:MAG: hypothetical protein ACXWPM_07875 [Bdellovibrionota bacterium]
MRVTKRVAESIPGDQVAKRLEVPLKVPKSFTDGLSAFEKADITEHVDIADSQGKKVIDFEGSSIRSAPGEKEITSKIESMGGRALLGEKIVFRGRVDIFPHMSLIHNTEVILVDHPIRLDNGAPSPTVSKFFRIRNGLRIMDVDSDVHGSATLEGVMGIKITGPGGLNAILDVAAGPEKKFDSQSPVNLTYWGEVYVIF